MRSYAHAPRTVKADYRPPRPTGKYWYFDNVQLWLQEALPQTQLEWLAAPAQCDGLDVRQGPARWDRAYQMRLQMRRPSHAALRSMATLRGRAGEPA
jgi:hypothetical protein